MSDAIFLFGSLAMILIGAELFTNGIEWFGHKLNLAEGAVGSVLAAVATAMPETLIPVIAIIVPVISGNPATASSEIGVGAILGAPFMLATLAMFVTGVAVILVARGGSRGTTMRVNVSVLGRDVTVFLIAYAIAIGTAFLPAALDWARWGIAAVLVIAYGLYVRAHFTDEADEGDPADLNRLHVTRLPGLAGPRAHAYEDAPADRPGDGPLRTPRLRVIVAQVLVALALIILGARVFVGAVEHVSTVIGMDPKILALIIAPIATELPEKFNSVIWVRAGKDTLAMGNITGAMVFQSCLPTVLGILFTEWRFGETSALAFASAGAAFLATLLIFGMMRRKGSLSGWTLLLGGPIYATYVIAALLIPVAPAALH